MASRRERKWAGEARSDDGIKGTVRRERRVETVRDNDGLSSSGATPSFLLFLLASLSSRFKQRATPHRPAAKLIATTWPSSIKAHTLLLSILFFREERARKSVNGPAVKLHNCEENHHRSGVEQTYDHAS